MAWGTTGVGPVAQPQASTDGLAALVSGFPPFQLAALHDLVAISGSLVLALAVARGRIGVDEAWDLSRIDETWQAEAWGVDEEAAALEAAKRRALVDAGRFLALCG